ncbi:VTT domain-containing protein [Zwartia sp.]|uniref:VTT domain-containing protein n=1 Tax=Zwartia sp. TaxID=2978004 RepID=UPI003BB195DC
MDFLSMAIDMMMHIDRTMLQFIEQHGAWIYVLLVAIIFAETGLVFASLLPGDSLLFVAGAICAMGKMDLPLLMLLLTTAAIVGDAVNYSVGRWFGKALIARTRLVNPARLAYTQGFFDRYGGQTIVIARFLPIARTMAPFVAGFAKMEPKKFFFFNVSGGILWVVSLTAAGYWFGNLPFVRDNLTAVILGIIIVSLLPGVIAVLRAKFSKPKTL